MSLPPSGTTDETGRRPARELLKRIDIGLTTGVVAVFISFLALVVAWNQTRLAQETAKAGVLPIIQIDMGYQRTEDAKYDFAVTLTNSGAGIAHIQTVAAEIDGEVVADYQAFEDAVMNRRMRGWARLTESPAAGFLRAGETRQPVHFAMNAASREVDTYLRGEYGTPLSGMDIRACYCSVFEDCWEVRFRDRRAPQPVARCEPGDALNDVFADYRDQRAAARLDND